MSGNGAILRRMPGTHEPGRALSSSLGCAKLAAPRTTLLTEGVHSPKAQDHGR